MLFLLSFSKPLWEAASIASLVLSSHLLLKLIFASIKMTWKIMFLTSENVRFHSPGVVLLTCWANLQTGRPPCLSLVRSMTPPCKGQFLLNLPHQLSSVWWHLSLWHFNSKVCVIHCVFKGGFLGRQFVIAFHALASGRFLSGPQFALLQNLWGGTYLIGFSERVDELICTRESSTVYVLRPAHHWSHLHTTGHCFVLGKSIMCKLTIRGWLSLRSISSGSHGTWACNTEQLALIVTPGSAL